MTEMARENNNNNNNNNNNPHGRHTTYLQPRKQLLMGWMVGGTMTGETVKGGRNNNNNNKGDHGHDDNSDSAP
jgi:hypothetical protein